MVSVLLEWMLVYRLHTSIVIIAMHVMTNNQRITKNDTKVQFDRPAFDDELCYNQFCYWHELMWTMFWGGIKFSFDV